MPLDRGPLHGDLDGDSHVLCHLLVTQLFQPYYVTFTSHFRKIFLKALTLEAFAYILSLKHTKWALILFQLLNFIINQECVIVNV